MTVDDGRIRIPNVPNHQINSQMNQPYVKHASFLHVVYHAFRSHNSNIDKLRESFGKIKGYIA